MKNYNIFVAIVFCVFVLPVFNDYFKVLPTASKYLLDFFILLYIAKNRKVLSIHSGFKNIYVLYFLVILAITFISILIHKEGLFYLVQESRRLIIPLALYLIIKHILSQDLQNVTKTHKLILNVFYLQIAVSAIQILFYSYFKRFHLFKKGELELVDAACGTLGQGGHSIIGVLVPLVFLYFFDLKKIKYALPLLIPFLLSNSGGGILAMGVALAFISLHTLVYGSVKYRLTFIISAAVFATVVTVYLGSYIEQWTYFFTKYQSDYIEKGTSTYAYRPHKIDRFNGYKYFNEKMNSYRLEHFVGLGYKFQEIGVKNEAYQFKSDVNFVIAERGYLGLAAYFSFFLITIIYLLRICRKNGYKSVSIKVFIVFLFLLSGFYGKATRVFPLWFIVIYVIAVVENKHLYSTLVHFVRGTNKING